MHFLHTNETADIKQVEACVKTDIFHKLTQTFPRTRSAGSQHDTVGEFVPIINNTAMEEK